jgi:hypothetical protein
MQLEFQVLEGRALLSAGAAASTLHGLRPAQVERLVTRIDHFSNALNSVEGRIKAEGHQTPRWMQRLEIRVAGLLQQLGPRASNFHGIATGTTGKPVPSAEGTSAPPSTFPPTGQGIPPFGLPLDSIPSPAPQPTNIPGVVKLPFADALGFEYVYRLGQPDNIRFGPDYIMWFDAHPDATAIPETATVDSWLSAITAQNAAAKAAADAQYVASLGGKPSLSLTGPTQAYFAVTPTKLAATVNPASAGGITLPAPQVVSYQWDLSQAPDASAEDLFAGSVSGQGTPSLKVDWGNPPVARRMNTITLTVTLGDQTKLTQSFSVEVIGTGDPSWTAALYQALGPPGQNQPKMP